MSSNNNNNNVIDSYINNKENEHQQQQQQLIANNNNNDNYFSLKRWNLVAMWSWDVECEVCAICRTQIMGNDKYLNNN
jgi:hypothetical protein